jgi:predicted flavoprotein YhiN
VSKSLIIIGGGASGMIAGILSARLGHRVTILEKLSSLGKKNISYW